MAKLTSVRGACFFCRMETENLIEFPDGYIPAGWVFVPSPTPDRPQRRVLCCPKCRTMKEPAGFMYGAPF